MASQQEIENAVERLRQLEDSIRGKPKSQQAAYHDARLAEVYFGIRSTPSMDRELLASAYLAERDGVKAMVEALERIGSNWAENPRDEADAALAKYKATGGHDKKQAKVTDDER